MFTGEPLRWSVFLIKLIKTSNFIKKRLQHTCEYLGILKSTYFEKHLGMGASWGDWDIKEKKIIWTTLVVFSGYLSHMYVEKNIRMWKPMCVTARMLKS